MNDNIDSNDTNQRRDRSAGQENLKSQRVPIEMANNLLLYTIGEEWQK